MYERTSKYHPDKVADRIAGSIVDLAYTNSPGGWLKSNPRVAVEVLIGHGTGQIIIETSCTRQELSVRDVDAIVQRISGLRPTQTVVTIVEQDPHLARNQADSPRCGDNGIFRGCHVTDEQRVLTAWAKTCAENFKSDGKHIISGSVITTCQSRATDEQLSDLAAEWLRGNGFGITREGRVPLFIYNPLGPWTGGIDTDSGATNRKLGSDMGDAVTGGGLHGKDLSKADVSVNIVCHILAQSINVGVTATCAIGDEEVSFRNDRGVFIKTMPFRDIIEQARLYILTQHGSFEHFAEWGLI